MYILKADINEINNFNIDDILNILSENEKVKLKKIKDKKNYIQSIIGKKLLIDGLKKYYNVDYNQLDLSFNENGKPYFKNKNIHFSISHSSDQIICVLSNNNIGVDIEKIRNIDIKVSNIFTSNNEKEYIFNNIKDINKRLFEVYVLKESYIKLKGLNMTDINKIEFKIGNVILCSNKNINAQLLYEIDDYIIGICEEKSNRDVI